VILLAEECGISADRPPDHMVLDDSTYPALWRSRLPYHLVYLTGSWGNAIGDLQTFLEQRKFGGVVSQCAPLPPSLRQAAKARDGLCCIAPSR
jgi:hypothetical protein